MWSSWPGVELSGHAVLGVLVASGIGCVAPAPSRPPLQLVDVPHVTLSPGSQGVLDSPIVLGGEERPCLTAPTPADVRFRLEIPPRALLTFAVGVRPAPAGEADSGGSGAAARKVRFRVRIGEQGPTTEVFRRDIHFSRADQWIDQSVDLHRYSQKEVWLSFESSVVDADGAVVGTRRPSHVGFFAEPILHDRARYGESRAVVVVSIDTLRRDHVSLYGYKRRTTPGLANLAGQSVVFEDAVSTSSWTLPAHASLFTSLYPSFHGAVNLHRGLASGLIGLPGLLQHRGFFTQAIVTHLYLSRQYGFGRGFDRHLFLPETRAEQVTDRAVAFLRSHGDRDFFLFLHYYDPHWHYDPPSPYDRAFDPSYQGSATGIWWDFKHHTRESIAPRDLHHIVALYDGEILYTDRQLARFFREMKRLGVFDEAVVVVTSDHGEEFLDHGGWEHQKTLYEEQIRVPLIVKLPGGARRGERIPRQVSLLDVAPTILEAAGIGVPPSFQGRSLFAEEGGDEKPAGNDVWSETEHTLDGSHKLSLRRGASARKFIFSVDGGQSDDTLVEIYDLMQDAKEMENLATSSPGAAEKERIGLTELLARGAEFRLGTAPAAPVELTPEQLDKLRALGYVR